MKKKLRAFMALATAASVLGRRREAQRRPVAVAVVAVGVAALGAAAVGASAAEATPAPDWSAYAQLLDEYLEVVPIDLEAGGDNVFETHFDYQGLLREPDREARLAACLELLETVDASSLAPAERLAFDINIYNIATIDVIIDALDTSGGTLASIMNAGAGSGAIFDRPLIDYQGRRYSLNQWERSRVFMEFGAGDGEPPVKLDPRAHFAVNCASLGCPSLMPEPYSGAELDAQLDRATRNALANPRHLRLELRGEKDGGTQLHGSQLFGWYAHDFRGAGGPLAFALKYAPAGIADQVGDPRGSGGAPILLADLPWDWALNQAAR